jgi:hypothetical protein
VGVSGGGGNAACKVVIMRDCTAISANLMETKRLRDAVPDDDRSSRNRQPSSSDATDALVKRWFVLSHGTVSCTTNCNVRLLRRIPQIEPMQNCVVDVIPPLAWYIFCDCLIYLRANTFIT